MYFPLFVFPSLSFSFSFFFLKTPYCLVFWILTDNIHARSEDWIWCCFCRQSIRWKFGYFTTCISQRQVKESVILHRALYLLSYSSADSEFGRSNAVHHGEKGAQSSLYIHRWYRSKQGSIWKNMSIDSILFVDTRCTYR